MEDQDIEIVIEGHSPINALERKILDIIAFHGHSVYLKNPKQMKLVFTRQVLQNEEDMSRDEQPKPVTEQRKLPEKGSPAAKPE